MKIVTTQVLELGDELNYTNGDDVFATVFTVTVIEIVSDDQMVKVRWGGGQTDWWPLGKALSHSSREPVVTYS